MALTTNTQSNAESIVNKAMGNVVTDAGSAADTVFTIGFVPRVIRWVNLTDRITLEWYAGMSQSQQSVRTVAAGTRTLDTSSFITTAASPANSGFSFTIKAADIPASKEFVWEAEG
jgi:hypothetical protein